MGDPERLTWPPPDRIWLGEAIMDARGLLPLAGAGAAVLGGIAGSIAFPPAAPALVGVGSATALGLLAGWAHPRMRPSWALTPTTFAKRPAIGRVRGIDVARIVDAEATPTRALRTGGSPERELVSVEEPHRVILRLDDGTDHATTSVTEARAIADLLRATVAGKVDLDLVPRADRTEVPGEVRDDVFFALETTWDRDTYGPCFAGPSSIVRWQSPLSLVRQSMLASIAGRTAPIEELEAEVLALARVETHHVAVIPRAGATITVGETAVVVRSPEREIEIGLAPARLAWARRHFSDRTSYRG